MQNTQEECCRPFDPTPWDGRTFEWKDKLFIKKDLPQLFHIPLPGTIGRMIGQSWEQIKKAGADPDLKDYLWLCYDPSPWKCENYIHVTKEVPGAENVKLSGTFMTKVFDGPFSSVPLWVKEMESYVASKGSKVQKLFFYYTTCPKCAKKYGKNYIVAFAQV